MSQAVWSIDIKPIEDEEDIEFRRECPTVKVRRETIQEISDRWDRLHRETDGTTIQEIDRCAP